MKPNHTLDTRIEHLLACFSPSELAFFTVAADEVERATTLYEKVRRALSCMAQYSPLRKSVFEFYLKGDDGKIRCVEAVGNNLSGKLLYIGKSIRRGHVTTALAEQRRIAATVDNEKGERKYFAEENNLVLSRFYPMGKTAVLVASKREYTARFTRREETLVTYARETLLDRALTSALRYAQLRTLAERDGLTGLYNRRYFQERLVHTARVQKRSHGRGLSLLLVDVDYFKKVNDTHGHPAGDRVLQDISLLIQNSVREEDTVARYGGEEIAVLLEATPKRRAVALAKRIQDAVKRYGVMHPQYTIPDEKENFLWPVSVSIGVACMPNDIIDGKDLVKAADEALYTSKRWGRNRITIYGADKPVV